MCNVIVEATPQAGIIGNARLSACVDLLFVSVYMTMFIPWQDQLFPFSKFHLRGDRKKKLLVLLEPAPRSLGGVASADLVEAIASLFENEKMKQP